MSVCTVIIIPWVLLWLCYCGLTWAIMGRPSMPRARFSTTISDMAWRVYASNTVSRQLLYEWIKIKINRIFITSIAFSLTAIPWPCLCLNGAEPWRLALTAADGREAAAQGHSHQARLHILFPWLTPVNGGSWLCWVVYVVCNLRDAIKLHIYHLMLYNRGWWQRTSVSASVSTICPRPMLIRKASG